MSGYNCRLPIAVRRIRHACCACLPVFSVHAKTLPGGDNATLVGLAMGTYGLAQSFGKIPFGVASDKYDRKKIVVIGLLLFALGSFIAAGADNIYWVIIGRAIQGAGAIFPAVTAFIADSTREEHRTKAMSLVKAKRVAWSEILSNGELMRLNYGVFALHMTQMAMFVVMPSALVKYADLPVASHCKIYLPVVLASFVLPPPVFVGEQQGKMKQVLVAAVALLLIVQLGLLLTFSLDIIRWQWLVVVVLGFSLLSMCWKPAIAGIAYCAASRQGRRAGRLQHHAGVRFVLRRRARGTS